MNVFVIPSWYPEPRYRLQGGVFVEEAVTELARHHPEVQLHVSLWGQGDRELSFGRQRAWLADPFPHGPPRPTRHARMPNLVEHSRPVWTWRFGIARGNLAGVLRANRENLASARAECGKIDLVHAHVSFPGGQVAQRLSEENGIPFILTEHMGPFPFRQYMRGSEPVPEVREPLRHAWRVTAVSRALAKEIRSKVGVEAMVIPNGVDETFFVHGPAAEVAPVRAVQDFTFLTVASLELAKGIGDLLRAIQQLDRSGRAPGARFRIAGGGSRAAEFRDLAIRLGVGSRIEWLGPLSRERVRDEMRACNAFVLTSHHESFGVVYVEALASGKPVIATRCGGPEDIVNTDNGVLVPVADAHAIAGALASFASREHPYDANVIRRDFEARFSSRVVAGRFAALYREAGGAR